MKRVILLCVVCLLGLGVLGSAALADTDITVTGTGTVRVNPDIAVITLGVQKTGTDISAIQAEANAALNAVIEALSSEEGGIDEGDIRTQYYTIYRDYSRYYENDDPIYYTANATLRVTVRDIEAAGRVIDLAFSRGATTLDGVTFAASDASDWADQALAAAVRDGMRRAAVMAEAAGLTLPSAPSKITEGAVSGVYLAEENREMAVEATADSAAGTSLMSGAIDVTAQVVITYEIET